jgi:hypothetical protein
MTNRRKSFEFVMLSETYTADLKGRQSVRTTFKLPTRCIDALSLLAGQLGIKQKSIFDHLVDDTQTLQALAREIESQETSRENRVAKTYVISRKTLENLEQVSRRFQAPRDALVEFSIERIMPLLQKEKQKHENRKTLAPKLNAFLKNGRELLEQADTVLDRDDPVFEKIIQMVGAVQSGCDEVGHIIEKGKKLEDF